MASEASWRLRARAIDPGVVTPPKDVTTGHLGPFVGLFRVEASPPRCQTSPLGWLDVGRAFAGRG